MDMKSSCQGKYDPLGALFAPTSQCHERLSFFSLARILWYFGSICQMAVIDLSRSSSRSTSATPVDFSALLAKYIASKIASNAAISPGVPLAALMKPKYMTKNLILISNCERCLLWSENSCAQTDCVASRSFADLCMNRIVGDGRS